MIRYAVNYNVDRSHMMLTAVSITSLVKNYQSQEELDIIIIAGNIYMQDIENIKKIPKQYGKDHIHISFWHPPQQMELIKNYENKRFPEVTLWRLFTPINFSHYDEILYLDNDTLITGNIFSVFGQVKEPNIIGIVSDMYFYLMGNESNLGDIFHVENVEKYFNSGVILFNVMEYNKVVSVDLIAELINTREYSFKFVDQGFLNEIAKGRAHYFGFEYNYQKDDKWLEQFAIPLYPEKSKEMVDARKKVIIRHFLEFGEFSIPWEHYSVIDEWEKEYWSYFFEAKINVSKK
ncbi:glycosyltransferase [Enterococcus sp. AZ103]|uniref:glycosyltransferase n=1 Tax=Enterococcus sp. AZ103 TaxID=2774628 RepID=UPI003F2470BD